MFKSDSAQVFIYLVLICLMFLVLVFFSKDYLFSVVGLVLGDKESQNKFIKPPHLNINPSVDYIALFNTTIGSFIVDLYEQNAPQNVNNFVYLATNYYYKGVRIHRIIPGVLFQSGDRNTLDKDSANDGFGHTGYFIKDEINWNSLDLDTQRKNKLSSLGYKSNQEVTSIPITPLSLVMANAGPNTNSSQFFITFSSVSKDNLKHLQGRFTNIGKVIGGYATIQQINQISVINEKPSIDVYIQDIIIYKK